MAKFNTGTVTIDKALQIVRGDKNFFQYIARENAANLAQTVCGEDLTVLREAIDRAVQSGHCMANYRVLRPDGSLHWVDADIRHEEIAGESFIHLDIQDVDNIETIVEIVQDELKIANTYLYIVDEIFFRYSIEEDNLYLFVGGDRNSIGLYHGSLEQWEQMLHDKNSIADNYHETFQTFCRDLHQGSRQFSHELTMADLIKGGANELYLVRGKTITNSCDELIVLGCFCRIAKNSKRKKVHLGNEASRDGLTGLLNKQTITEYVKSTLAGKPDGLHYLCVLDIDYFKSVNDRFGHLFGDEVLITVADIMKEAVGDRGALGRIGGDEMLIFLENIKDRADLKSVLRTIRSNVEWAYKGVHEDLHLSCSIGAAAYPVDGDDYDSLFNVADKMLYRAKENGRNRYIIYTPEIHGDVANLGQPAVPVNKKAKNIPVKTKEELIQDLLDRALYRQVMSIQMILEEVGVCFGLKEIAIGFDREAFKVVAWNVVESDAAGASFNYAAAPGFSKLFNESRLAVVHHATDAGVFCAELMEYMNSRHVTSAIIFRIQGNYPGYVAFFKEDASSRLWASSDIAYLSFAGKIIELVHNGRA